MKKILFLSMLAGAVFLASCASKPSPKSVADKICSIGERMLKAESEGKQDEVKKAEDEMQAYGKEIQEKYKDNKKFLDEVDGLVKTCRKELEAKYETDDDK